MTALSTTCPHCGAVNEFIAVELHKASDVNCSHCKAPLGPWGKILQSAASRGEIAPNFESNWPLDDARPKLERSRKTTAD